MASKIRILLIIFLAIILEISFFPALFAGKIMPDILLIIIILWSSRRKFEEILPWVFLSGFLLDLTVSGKFGINAFSLVLISFLVSFLRRRFFIIQRTGAFFIAFFLVMGGTFLNFVLWNFLSDFKFDFSLSLLGVKMLSNLLIAIVVYVLFFNFKGVFGISENKLIAR